LPLTLVIPVAVIAEVPIGFVVLQVRFTLQLLLPEEIVQEGDAGVSVPNINVAETVQALVIVPVV